MDNSHLETVLTIPAAYNVVMLLWEYSERRKQELPNKMLGAWQFAEFGFSISYFSVRIFARNSFC